MRIYAMALFGMSVIMTSGIAQAVEVRSFEHELQIDQLTRYPQIQYRVPVDAPPALHISCHYQDSEGNWQPASVFPLMSHAGLSLVSSEIKAAWAKGMIVEEAAAGQERMITWAPYNVIAPDVDRVVPFRMQFADPNGKKLGGFELEIIFRNRDVVAIHDFQPFIPEGSQARVEKENGAQVLIWAGGEEDRSKPSIALGPTSAGRYAVYFDGKSEAWVSLADRPYERLRASRTVGNETYAGTFPLTGTALKFRPSPNGTGASAVRIKGLRLVPAPAASASTSESEKIVAGYFEPYSWAFYRKIEQPEDYLDVSRLYQEFGFNFLDVQFGRFGARLVYETNFAKEDRFLVKETVGDQTGAQGKRTQSKKVWSMVEKTKPLADMHRAASQSGLVMHANFGATNCYPDMPLQSSFSMNHPELHRKRGNFLALGEPKVQEYMLSIYKETLAMGAPGVSIDFCRYPFGVDQGREVTEFLRKLRALTAGFSPHRTILVRFPAKGERRSQQYDYEAWIKEGLVDYLCPSNIFSTVLHFDVAPYVNAAKGSQCKVLPVIDTIPAGGFRFIEPLLMRASTIYKAGADGIYLYQPDAHLFTISPLRDTLKLLKSPEAIEVALKEISDRRRISTKAILIEPPSHQFLGGYRASNDRVRFWLEGDIGPEVEIIEGSEVIQNLQGYPYLLGEEATDAEPLVTHGPHRLRVRARDGEQWMEKIFEITTVAPHRWD